MTRTMTYFHVYIILDFPIIYQCFFNQNAHVNFRFNFAVERYVTGKVSRYIQITSQLGKGYYTLDTIASIQSHLAGVSLKSKSVEHSAMVITHGTRRKKETKNQRC